MKIMITSKRIMKMNKLLKKKKKKRNEMIKNNCLNENREPLHIYLIG